MHRRAAADSFTTLLKVLMLPRDFAAKTAFPVSRLTTRQDAADRYQELMPLAAKRRHARRAFTTMRRWCHRRRGVGFLARCGDDLPQNAGRPTLISHSRRWQARREKAGASEISANTAADEQSMRAKMFIYDGRIFH